MSSWQPQSCTISQLAGSSRSCSESELINQRLQGSLPFFLPFHVMTPLFRFSQFSLVILFQQDPPPPQTTNTPPSCCAGPKGAHLWSEFVIFTTQEKYKLKLLQFHYGIHPQTLQSIQTIFMVFLKTTVHSLIPSVLSHVSEQFWKRLAMGRGHSLIIDFSLYHQINSIFSVIETNVPIFYNNKKQVVKPPPKFDIFIYVDMFNLE